MVQILSPTGIVLVEESQVLVFGVLLWPLIDMHNHSHSISTHILRIAHLEYPAPCVQIRD